MVLVYNDNIKICKGWNKINKTIFVYSSILKEYKNLFGTNTVLLRLYPLKWIKIITLWCYFFWWQGVVWPKFTWHFHLIKFFGQTPKFKAFDRIIRSTAKIRQFFFVSWSKLLLMSFWVILNFWSTEKSQKIRSSDKIWNFHY